MLDDVTAGDPQLRAAFKARAVRCELKSGKPEAQTRTSVYVSTRRSHPRRHAVRSCGAWARHTLLHAHERRPCRSWRARRCKSLPARQADLRLRLT